MLHPPWRSLSPLLVLLALTTWAPLPAAARIFDPLPQGWKVVWIFDGATADQLDPGKVVTMVACTNLTDGDLPVRVESFLSGSASMGEKLLGPGQTGIWARPVALLVGESGTNVLGTVRVTALGKKPDVVCSGSVWVDPDGSTPRPANLQAWSAEGKDTLKVRQSSRIQDRIISKLHAGKILYVATGVQDSASLAAAFYCTNLSGKDTAQLRFEFFKADGSPAGATDRGVPPGNTTVVETRPIVVVGAVGGLAGLERNMSLRIIGVDNAKNVVCSATGYVGPGADAPVSYNLPLLPVQKPRPRVGR